MSQTDLSHPSVPKAQVSQSERAHPSVPKANLTKLNLSKQSVSGTGSLGISDHFDFGTCSQVLTAISVVSFFFNSCVLKCLNCFVNDSFFIYVG